MFRPLLLSALLLFPLVCKGELRTVQQVARAAAAPSIDGDASDPVWEAAQWRSIGHVLVGSAPASAQDFSGRYKLLWTPQRLYLLAEIQDDVLFDQYADPLHNYWDDDALEILVDPDASGGPHQFDDSAFAYHIALDNQVVDIAPGSDGGPAGPRLYSGHVDSVWKRSPQAPHAVIWELAIRLMPDPVAVAEGRASPGPQTLVAGQQIGFAVAYCDADSSAGRSRLMADVEVAAVEGDRNRLYLDADSFGRLRLQP